LTDAMLAGQQEVIAQVVADGRLTQEQADWILAKTEAIAPTKSAIHLARAECTPLAT
jgi:hypothetical protein